jgi:mannose-6-phosphate isomerase-like protein (cupin superfamily)
MKGFVKDIEKLAVESHDFRRVLYTAKNCQLVTMALKPGEEIGAEVHHLDQFFRVEAGTGEAVLDGVHTPIAAGFAVLVPAGARHNIINTGVVPLKLYTLYAPPNHRDGVVHRTRAEAEQDTEHFDGRTTESPKAVVPRMRSPLVNPNPQKSGRTLQGHDQSPGLKGKRPVVAPRRDAKQRKGTESHQGAGK